MTTKLYKSAMGKPVDLGALLLQNEQTRAVGNMNINARGDTIDGTNKVIDKKTRQVQRQLHRQTVKNKPAVPAKSTLAIRQEREAALAASAEENMLDDEFDIQSTPATFSAEDNTESDSAPRGGLAAAIARSRTIKQEKEKSLREIQQETRPGINKI